MERQEQISALIDEALNESEANFLLRQLAADKQGKESISRYTMIGDAMRGQLNVASTDFSFADRVMAKIEAEELLQGATEEQSSVVSLNNAREAKQATWAKPAIGFALAASLALIAVFLSPIGQQNVNDGLQLNGMSASVPVNTSNVSYDAKQDVKVQWWLAEPEAEQRMSRYMFQRDAENKAVEQQLKGLDKELSE